MIVNKAKHHAASLRRFGAFGTALILASLFPAGVSAATPAPHWSITSTASPSHYAPGDTSGNNAYHLTITNTGGAATNGSPIVITDTLPPGLTVNPSPTELHGEFAAVTENSFGPHYPCSAGPPVTCVIPSETIYPGVNLAVFIPVNVASLPAGETFVNQATISGGGAPEAVATEQTTIDPDPAPFDFQSIDTSLTDVGGNAETRAGSHPYRFHLGFQLNTIARGAPSSSLRDLTTKLPPGLVLNPNATPVRCTEAQLETKGDNGASTCPDASAVGLVQPTVNAGEFASNLGYVGPIYNMVPPPGVAGEFAFDAAKLDIFVHILGRIDSAGNYALIGDSREILQAGGVSGVGVEFWGNPSDPSHDRRRGNCGEAFALKVEATCPVAPSNTPLVTMPSACSGPLTVSLSADSWTDSGNFIDRSAQTVDSEGNPVEVNGCSVLNFTPNFQSRPTAGAADSPSGLDFNLNIPQSSGLDTLATSNLKKAVVTLPEGLVVNTAAGNGLDACSSAQIGLTTPIGSTPIHFTAVPPACPNASKIGTVEVNTPLLDHPLPGVVYIAKPKDNPFGSLVAVYIVIDDPQSGVVVKLAGHVVPDPATGRLTATFDENPQVPFSDFKLSFFQGPSATLRTPATCGTYTTTSTMTPWSNPSSGNVFPSDSFRIASGAGGGRCANSEAELPHKPSFEAGTATPIAGSYSPFVLKLSREDGSQQLRALNVTLPPGLSAKLAGVQECSNAQIAVAEARNDLGGGALEQANPSCPKASEIGVVNVGAGSGTPFFVQGHAYLAGPYKGAPLSVAIITPGVAGPFDLGAVVVRSALYVDETTAQVTVKSDPFPTILHGIPLDVRSVAVLIDRQQFMLNPTSCEAKAISGQAVSTTGAVAQLSNRFQVGACNALGFKPNFTLNLKGGTKRSQFPALKAVVTYPKGSYANIAKAQVTLPHSEFLEQAHFRTICTRVQFAANACPSKSIYGRARAFTPLLDKPLEGPVYLRSSSHELPDLAVDLNGQVHFVLVGRNDSVEGRIRNTFENTPDAPLSKFVLEMQGGKKGLFVNSTNICKKTYRATVKLTAQNGKTHNFNPPVGNSCGKKKRGK